MRSRNSRVRGRQRITVNEVDTLLVPGTSLPSISPDLYTPFASEFVGNWWYLKGDGTNQAGAPVALSVVGSPVLNTVPVQSGPIGTNLTAQAIEVTNGSQRYDSAVTANPTGSFSLICLKQPWDVGTNNYFLVKGTSNNTLNWQYASDTSNSFRVYKSGGSSSAHATGPSSVTVRGLQLFVATYEFVADGSSVMRQYINGVETGAAVTTAVGPVKSGTEAWKVMGDSTFVFGDRANYVAFAFTEKVLSATTVAQMAALAIGGVASTGKGKAVTTTRSTPATYTRADGRVVVVRANIPRVFNDGLLVESAHSGGVRFTDNLNGVRWTRDNVAIDAASSYASDGSKTMNLYTVAAGNAVHRVYQFHNLASRLSSVFVKRGSVRYFTLGQSSLAVNNCTITLDLDTGSVVDSGGTNYVDGGVIVYPGGLYRVWSRYGSDHLGTTDISFADSILNSKPYTSWNAAGTETGYVWRVNGEVGVSYSTSPVSGFTDANTTRTLDAVSIPTTGWPTANGQITFTITPDWSTPDTTLRYLFAARSGTNGFSLQKNVDDNVQLLGGGLNAAAMLSWTRGQSYSMRLVWSASATTLYRDGVAVISAGGATFASWLATCGLGNAAGANAWGGTISNFKVTSF